MRDTLRRVGWAAYAGYLACVTYLVWTPTPSAPGRAVVGLTLLGVDHGVAVNPALVEFGLNVLMLVPLGLLGRLLWPRLSVPDWTFIGFLASLTIEAGQALALPTRTPSAGDVVANTAGALLGAALATSCGALLRARPAAARR